MHRSHQTNVSSTTQISPVLDERALRLSFLLCKDCIKCGGVSGASMVTSLEVESFIVLPGTWHDALEILVSGLQWTLLCLVILLLYGVLAEFGWKAERWRSEFSLKLMLLCGPLSSMFMVDTIWLRSHILCSFRQVLEGSGVFAAVLARSWCSLKANGFGAPTTGLHW